MKELISKAKTVDEALLTGLRTMGLSIDDVTYEVLEEGSKGFLGLGAKDAVVRIVEKESKEREAKAFLTGMLERLGVKVNITMESTMEDVKQIKIKLHGKDAGLLIGKRGQTLDSIQYLVSLVVNRKGGPDTEYTRVILDIDGYRAKREDVLIKLANRLADKAVRTGRRVTLEPMNPQERRIIHTTLQDHAKVYTYSEGEDPYRNIIIDLK